MNCKMNAPLSGIIPPLVTPLLDDDVLDVEGLNRLIEHLIAGGVHALFVLGTTGEAQSLSYKLRVEMIKNTCRITKGRLPVLVCISDTSIVESVNLARIAADNGADAVVSAPPYYFAAGQPELIEFYENLTPQLPLPLFLYNMPTHTKVNFAPATIQRIAEDPRVIGFKDSSANAVYFQSVMYALKERQDFSMLVGPEEIMAESVLLGAHGGVNGGANMFPELYVELYNAAKNTNLEELKRLQEKVMQISATIYTVGQHGSSYLKGLKCALNLLGICSDYVAAPFHKFEQREREKIWKALQKLGINVVLR
ncbi:dihydrodipicolinate synthase family protein [Bacteroides zhangwenhongii]|jgi:dihydrodipicolinate synthase/N-acetylneuraminate lyase|uniref:dihydrodipicolinate synthase family protein n=1 Tax=Bacteroides TaxID=816 RepID=UPI000820F783|nr:MULTISPECIES: dihydrodipicolinate synthase family protein [Bacteroides]SCH31004.1 Probable 2-keto-3-deoxy-galactonate aldolase YagE [uncultured Bacteroides sp.]